jgi:hypothetical protein
MAREWHRFLNGIWLYLCEKSSREEATPFGIAFRSLRTHKIHPEPLVERLCWFVFLENQPSRGAEWLASQVGHDWRSLKSLRRRLDEFLAERHRLEALAGRPLDSLRRRAEKLEREAGPISPSAVLAPDIMGMPPPTLEGRSRLIQEAVPFITSYLERFRQEQRSEAEDALAWLVDHGVKYAEITELLTATAQALGIESTFDPDALKMRLWRSRNPL